MKKEKQDTIYTDLYFNHPKYFKLMENSANALLLQFKKPLKYDLTIPRFYHIKTLMHILIDDLRGIKIDPSKVNCTTGSNYPDITRFKFNGKFPKKVEKGLELCFAQYNKYDDAPLKMHLGGNNENFGYEDNFYRFREGKRKEIQKKVEKYFNKTELKAFEEIGNFIMPFISNLDASVQLNN